MPIEKQLDPADLILEEDSQVIRKFVTLVEDESLRKIKLLPESDNRARMALVQTTISYLIDLGIDKETIESELGKRRTAGKDLDQVSLFSEHVKLRKRLFVNERQLNGDFASDPDQLLADWYASDEFSALMQTHAAMAKNVTVTGTGQ